MTLIVRMVTVLAGMPVAVMAVMTFYFYFRMDKANRAAAPRRAPLVLSYMTYVVCGLWWTIENQIDGLPLSRWAPFILAANLFGAFGMSRIMVNERRIYRAKNGGP